LSTNFNPNIRPNSIEDENEALLDIKPRNTQNTRGRNTEEVLVFSDDFSYCGILRKNCRYGIPSAFSIGDYFMCSLLLKFLVAATEDHELAAATAYYTAFFSCLMQAMNLGIIETQGIFGSQAFGNKDFQYLHLLLRQSVFTSTLMFLIFTIPPSFFIKTALEAVGIDHIIAERSQNLVVYALPGMFLRIINDNLKTFIQSQGHMRSLGIANIMVYLPLIPFSYFTIVKWHLGAMSFGLSIMFYEVLVFIMCLYFLNYVVDPESIDP
jgi:Na+-driven multidrug efflux pump